MADDEVKSRIIVQSDWDTVLREDGGKAWVTYRHDTKEEKKRTHGSLKCHGISSNGTPYLSGTDGFHIEDIALSKKVLSVSYTSEADSQKCRFQAPVVSFSTVHDAHKHVLSLDVTPGGLAVSSDNSGSLKIWTTHNGEVRRRLEGHYADVDTCRFFPSGLVILTGGGDMQLKIWSAETGKCAATLIGHRAGITDTAIVERGRNVVSVSRDGTAKLWNCGSQQCVTTLEDLGGVINCCSLGVPIAGVELGQPEVPPVADEILTEDKLVLLAVDSGYIHGYGLHSRNKVFSYNCQSPVNCCSFLSDTLVVCGTDDSTVFLFDLRNTSLPLKHIKESRSGISSLLPYKRGVFITTGDGSCYYITEDYHTDLELSGPDCDPVYRAVSDGTHLYTTCRDGLIRKYKHKC